MKRFKYMALAALVAFAACDEGTTDVVETVAGTISGVVTIEGVGKSGVTVTLSGGQTATTDGSGAYSFSSVAAGAYTVTISGYPTDATFSATSKAAVISSNGQTTTVNFDGAYVRTSAILGAVSAGGAGLADVTVSLSGTSTASATTDANGQYAFSGLRAGTYTVKISGYDAALYTFPATSADVTVTAGQSKSQSFSGSYVTTAKITGRLYIDENDKNDNYDGGLEENLSVANVSVTLEGGAVNNTTTVETDANGVYTFSNLAPGAYRVTLAATDTDIPGNVAFGGASAQQLVTITAGATATVDWPFDITQQAIKVFAFLGTDADVSATPGPGHAPIKGWQIDLYDTQSNAAAGGATGKIGSTLTTDATGGVTFRFARTADKSPNSAESDQIVFARSVNTPAFHAPNGETIIEIKYSARDSVGLAPDSLDALNTRVVVSAFAQELDGDTLKTWVAAMRNNKDSTTATIYGTANTNSKGKVFFTVPGTVNTFPDTFWIRLADAQPNANGHAFSQNASASAGQAFGRSLRFIWTGTTPASDTVMLGTSTVSYKDSNVTLRAHHEADDSTDVPVYTAGDNFTAAPNIAVQLENAAGTVVAGPTPVTAGTGLVTFANVPVGTYTARALSGSPTMDLLTAKTVSVGLDGSDQTYTDATLKGNAGNSTFAYKFNNNTINGTALAADGTAAAGIKIKLMATADNIQPNKAKDTTLVTTAGGAYSVTGVRDGPYSLMAMDSVTAAGDSIWAFLTSPSATVDVQGTSDTKTKAFVATRMDTKIMGIVANDRDSDFNTLDPLEALSGVTVRLYRDGSGAVSNTDTLVAETTTDASGAYSFTKLREGSYIVKATSPSNATVLRSLSAAGVRKDTAIVYTAAAPGAGNFLHQNYTRQVGTTDPAAQNDELPRWNYTTSAAAADAGNLGGGTGPNALNGARTTMPTHFIHLFSTGTIKGKVTLAAGTAVAGVRVTITQCYNSATAPSPPAGGTCAPKLASTARNYDTDASGNFIFTGLLEGVYQIDVAPATAGYTNALGPDGVAASGDENMLATLQGDNDVETVANYIIS